MDESAKEVRERLKQLKLSKLCASDIDRTRYKLQDAEKRLKQAVRKAESIRGE